MTLVCNRHIYHQELSDVWWQQTQLNSTYVASNTFHHPWKSSGNPSATPVQFSEPRLSESSISTHIASQSRTSQINHPFICRV